MVTWRDPSGEGTADLEAEKGTDLAEVPGSRIACAKVLW